MVPTYRARQGQEPLPLYLDSDLEILFGLDHARSILAMGRVY